VLAGGLLLWQRRRKGLGRPARTSPKGSGQNLPVFFSAHASQPAAAPAVAALPLQGVRVDVSDDGAKACPCGRTAQMHELSSSTASTITPNSSARTPASGTTLAGAAAGASEAGAGAAAKVGSTGNREASDGGGIEWSKLDRLPGFRGGSNGEGHGGGAGEGDGFGGYERVRLLGKGAHGRAILLRSRDSAEFVVAKEVALGGMGPEVLRSVENEVRILAALHHPAIVAYHGAFRSEGMLAIVMEYADRGSLAELLAAQASLQAPLRPQAVMRWLRQLGSALQHTHAKKVLHRDLKTANVFLASRGGEGGEGGGRGEDDLDVKLGDFGISRAMSTQTNLAETVCGTPYYMSPELVRGEPYHEPADVWALGVIAFEMLTLRRPFEANNMGRLVLAIAKGEYDEAALQGCSHEARLTRLASRDGLLNPDPQQRLRLQQLLDALDEIEGAPA